MSGAWHQASREAISLRTLLEKIRSDRWTVKSLTAEVNQDFSVVDLIWAPGHDSLKWLVEGRTPCSEPPQAQLCHTVYHRPLKWRDKNQSLKWQKKQKSLKWHEKHQSTHKDRSLYQANLRERGKGTDKLLRPYLDTLHIISHWTNRGNTSFVKRTHWLDRPCFVTLSITVQSKSRKIMILLFQEKLDMTWKTWNIELDKPNMKHFSLRN